MNKLYPLLISLLLASVASASPYQGKLDIGNLTPSAIVFRDLQNGVWKAGIQYQVFHVQNNVSGNEVLHLSGYWATRLEGQNKTYGPALGANIGEAAHAFLQKIEVVDPVLYVSSPPWLSKVSSWASVEVYGGYTPNPGGGDKPWMYGLGGKVTIPFDSLYSWASGTQAQGTGVKGL